MQEANNMTVRRAIPEDSKRVWEIRNHPVSRKYSGNPDEIPYESHVPWFEKKYFSGQDNHCFVLVTAGSRVIGYCRLDADEALHHYVISIALDPDFQGKGLGHKLLSETLAQFKRSKEIFAEIHKENTPSIKLFEKNGFAVQREDEERYYLTLG